MKKTLLIIICIFLLATLLQACGTNEEEKTGPIQWSTLELAALLPEPQGMNGKVDTDLAHALIVTLKDVTKEQYNEYKGQCINAGYIIESDDTGTSYVAFNSDGYQLRIVYSGDDLRIYLEAPEEMSEFEWPTNGLGAMIPATRSTFGHISWNNSKTFIVHVGNTTIDEYNDYVEACQNKGFIVEFSKSDEYYSAKDSGDYKLTLRYLGFNRIEVSLKAPEGGIVDDGSGNSSGNTKPSGGNANGGTANGIRKEFKEAMDSYEQFMDEYVAFMKKYKDNPSDMSLLADYANYVSKYAEFVRDFGKWQDQTMNTEETAYYIDVQSRVTKKLLEVTQ